MSRIHAIPFKVGTYVMGETFPGGKWFDISLKDLPHHIQFGVGHLTELSLRYEGDFSTDDGSAAISSYDLHSWLDWEFYGPENFPFFKRKGWMDPVRAAVKHGYVPGTRPTNIASNATGNRVVTAGVKQSKHFEMVEENMGPMSMYGRCIPSAALAKSNSKVRIFVYDADREVRPASASGVGKWDELEVTLYAHILDLPSAVSILPVLVEEGAAEDKAELNPTPGNGMYSRVIMANDPAMETTEDELDAYTKVNSFGTSGNFAREEEDVEDLLSNFHAEITDAIELPRPTNAAFTGQKKEFRALDPLQNDDGFTRGIPLVYVRPGTEWTGCRAWYGAEPTLRANDNSKAGLPATVTFIYDRVMPRESKHVAKIVGALGDKARGKRPMMNPNWGDPKGIDLTRIPLIVDGRE